MVEPVAGGFPGEPGADGAGAEADQAGQVVGAPALAGVGHQGDLQTQPQAQEVLVNRSNRK